MAATSRCCSEASANFRRSPLRLHRRGHDLDRDVGWLKDCCRAKRMEGTADVAARAER